MLNKNKVAINEDSTVTSGGCFCGSVKFEVKGLLRGVVNCHCSQCRHLNGNFGSHSKATSSNVFILKDEGLTWFNISDNARRGFCNKCGSGLFWEARGQKDIGIVVGSIDSPTGLKTIGHIFVGEKSDFYDITDDLQQFQQSSNGELIGDFV